MSKAAREANKQMQSLVDSADQATHGDSNDSEIARLQDALEYALTRWPKVVRRDYEYWESN
ncbi:hypothetical protein [Micromonospora sp. NBC_01813]|uniref:hypothetical protein n=1 Tax=Micromonospora sp. NBC_01813 TaxID=2975988 RepID=UPI002DD9E558|nr:hypothetical protein [Micromonospora sp. NBC_01813]WSA11516.1 hypothetical protein OG958_12460 [Micromonospora sp. NBC_01813]